MFSIFPRIMYPLYQHSSGSRESIAPNRFRNSTDNTLFRAYFESRSNGTIYGPKNGLAQSIPESLKNVNTEGT